jgi:hypothetical protein
MQSIEASKKLEYSPLDSDGIEIRLLHLHPPTTSTSIECTLSKASLLDPPPYDALSYCWGAWEPAKYINCNGTEVKVTPSLYSALERMRQNGHFTLWVDAICINQDDNGEKGRQVPRIGTIFRMADRVVAWVGESANSVEKLKPFIDALSYEQSQIRSVDGDDEHHYHSYPEGLFMTGDTQRSSADSIVIDLREQRLEPKLGKHIFDPEELKYARKSVRFRKSIVIQGVAALERYLQRPYWRRIWIIQELALGQDITIYCGTDAITWQNLLAAVHILFQNKLLSSEASRSFRNILACHQNVSSNQPVNLLAALERSSHALATDPRDKVYGILGLAYDASVYAPVPNYRQSVLEMCVQITKQSIRNLKLLDIVPLLGSANIAADMPSWVPPWTSLGDRNLGRQINYLTGNGIFSVAQNGWVFKDKYGKRQLRSRCQAAGLTKPALRYLQGILRTDACLFDRIDRVSGTVEQGCLPIFGGKPQRSAKLKRTTFGDRQVLLAIWLLFTYRDDSLYSTADIIEAITELWTKPSLDYMQKSHPDMRNWLDLHQHFPIHDGIGMRKFLESMSWKHQEKITHTLKGKYERLTNGLSDYRRRLFIDSLWKPLQDNLRLMVSSVDNRLGWVTTHARPGDGLYLLKGCGVIAVLRPKPGGGYTVVGDAFVHGVMSGELVGQNGPLKGKWEEIDIY